MSTGRDDPDSVSEKRSESQAGPFEGCAEWFEKMKEWCESSGGQMDVRKAMRSGCCAEREEGKGDG